MAAVFVMLEEDDEDIFYQRRPRIFTDILNPILKVFGYKYFQLHSINNDHEHKNKNTFTKQ